MIEAINGIFFGGMSEKQPAEDANRDLSDVFTESPQECEMVRLFRVAGRRFQLQATLA